MWLVDCTISEWQVDLQQPALSGSLLQGEVYLFASIISENVYYDQE